MEAFITSFVFVVLAEMGDKTQLLGMCFATRYRWQTVLGGVFVATILNHYLAVEVGSYLTRFIPMSYIQIAAAVSFIVFGLWTIRGDEMGDCDASNKYSPFWTVVIAFFIAEMGDKTQLATVALAAKYNQLIPVWMGISNHIYLLWFCRVVSNLACIPAFSSQYYWGRSACTGSYLCRKSNG